MKSGRCVPEALVESSSTRPTYPFWTLSSSLRLNPLTPHFLSRTVLFSPPTWHFIFHSRNSYLYSCTPLLDRLTFCILSYTILAGCFCCVLRQDVFAQSDYTFTSACRPGGGIVGGFCLHADLHLVCCWQLTFLLHMCRFGTVFSSFRQPVVCVAFTGRMLAARAGPLSVKPLHTSFITFYICMNSNSGVSHLRHIHIPCP